MEYNVDSGRKPKVPGEEQKEEEKVELEKTAKDKDKADALREAGNNLFRTQKYEKAIVTYTEAFSFNHTDTAILTNRAAANIKLKRYRVALEDAALAKSIDPKWLKTYYREGEAYGLLKEFGEAAASYWEGIRIDPSNEDLKKRMKEAMAKGKKQHKKLKL